ncbi:sulfatase-like hydrolase/transferase [Rhodobacterales bacterium]|nr:sulfatase-like hydrolase/transferase [Rhodobacterales bacterium]
MFSRILTSMAVAGLTCTTMAASSIAQEEKKPNILFIVSDDTGYGDTGPYLGGETRGMPTPNIDKLAEDGMMFTQFYAQPSCTPGRGARRQLQGGLQPARR